MKRKPRIVYSVYGITTKGKRIPLGGAFKSERKSTKRNWEGSVFKGKKIKKIVFRNPVRYSK